MADIPGEPRLGPKDETAERLSLLTLAAAEAAAALSVFEDLAPIRDYWQSEDYINNVRVYHVKAALKAKEALTQALLPGAKDGGQ